MTSKKRRQRGSRTHGGGTHKNRRGAGHRGGRGAAGRSKHEFHNYGPLGKHGFKRPEKAQDTILTIDVQELDENAPLYAGEDLAEETAEGYALDVRDLVEDGYKADAVKVLGGGQIRTSLAITADAFSASAVTLIEENGGEAIVSERGQVDDEEPTDDGSKPEDIEPTAEEA